MAFLEKDFLGIFEIFLDDWFEEFLVENFKEWRLGDVVFPQEGAGIDLVEFVDEGADEFDLVGRLLRGGLDHFEQVGVDDGFFGVDEELVGEGG